MPVLGQVQVAGGDAKSLSDLVSPNVAPKAHLLHVTTRHHKDEPAASLRSAGFTIVSWDAYEAQAMASLPLNAQEALRAGRIAAALQYSRRSADLFLQLATEANLISTLGHFPHLCLSEDVAEPLRALGLSVRVAATPDEPALLAMLDALRRSSLLRQTRLTSGERNTALKLAFIFISRVTRDRFIQSFRPKNPAQEAASRARDHRSAGQGGR